MAVVAISSAQRLKPLFCLKPGQTPLALFHFVQGVERIVHCQQRTGLLFRQRQRQVVVVTGLGAVLGGQRAVVLTGQLFSVFHEVATDLHDLQAQLLKAMRQVLAQTEDVGERFADQARAMHHGEIDQRNIRGRTTPEVAMELIEEGINVLPLPALPALKETLQ